MSSIIFKGETFKVTYCKRLKEEEEQRKRKGIKMRKRIQEILDVSNKIKLELMREALKMDKELFNQKIVEWTTEFGFNIVGDYLIVEDDTHAKFIDVLDDHFAAWERMEEIKGNKKI